MTVTAQDIREFRQYLKNCTDRQVLGVLENEEEASERDPDREIYADLARVEAELRNL